MLVCLITSLSLYILTSGAPPSELPSPMVKYANYLRSVYSSTSDPKPALKWLPKPVHEYINLSIIRKDGTPLENSEIRMATLRGDVDQVMKKKCPVDMTHMCEGGGRKIILIEGAPGCGKSTFSFEVCRRWGIGKIPEYQAVILLPLRQSNIQMIKKTEDLFEHTMFRDEETQRALAEDVISSSGDGILLILDGFDELPPRFLSRSSFFTELLQGVTLTRAAVIVTCRLIATPHLQAIMSGGAQPYEHYEIIGFTDDAIQEFLQDKDWLLQHMPRLSSVRQMMYLPLNAAIINEVCSRLSRDIPPTMTTVYKEFVLKLLIHYICQNETDPQTKLILKQFNELPQSMLPQFRQLCEIGYRGIEEGKYTFPHITKDFTHFDLMIAACDPLPPEPYHTSYNFLHLSLQEFLAALHISNVFTTVEIMSKLKETLRRRSFNRVWMFYAGLTKLAGISKKDLETMLTGRSEEREPQCRALVLSCLQESQNVQLTRDLMGQYKLLGGTVSNPSDSYALAFCINNSSCPWDVTVSGGELSLQFFTIGLHSHAQVNSLTLTKCKLTTLEQLLQVMKPVWKNTVEMNLDHNCLTQAACAQLVTLAPSLHQLHALSLSHNPGIGSSGAKGLLNTLHDNKCLKTLRLSNTGIGLEDIMALCPLVSRLKELDVSGNSLTMDAVVRLGDAVKSSRVLEVLNLADCSLPDKAARHLAAKSIEKNTSLLQLNLSRNALTKPGFQGLAEMLKKNATLQLLTLRGYKCDSISVLFSNLRHNKAVNLVVDPQLENEVKQVKSYHPIQNKIRFIHSSESDTDMIPSSDSFRTSPCSDPTRSSKSSSSYLSASSINFTDEFSLSTSVAQLHLSNIESPPPKTLTQPVSSPKTTAQPLPPNVQSVPTTSSPQSGSTKPQAAQSGKSRSPIVSESISHSEKATQPHFPKQSGSSSPFTVPQQPRATLAGTTAAGPAHSATPSLPQGDTPTTSLQATPSTQLHANPSLSQVFRDAVREYDAEAVERVLGRGGVEVDMVISEEVRWVYT